MALQQWDAPLSDALPPNRTSTTVPPPVHVLPQTPWYGSPPSVMGLWLQIRLMTLLVRTLRDHDLQSSISGTRVMLRVG
jgi:hypothetical protein